MPNSEAKDEDHLIALEATQELMKDPNAMGDWFENKRKEFDAL